MRRIVYTKYSNDRDPAFRIRTDIVEDESGRRYVCKKNVDSRGQNHINNMYQNYTKLQSQFANTRFFMNQTIQTEEGLEFEFLSGDSLEHLLDQKLNRRDMEGLLEQIKEFAAEIKKAAQKEFVSTPEFEKIFGEWNLARPMMSLEVSDIDMIFQNIIIEGNKWEVIDYEWSYAFPIPVDWIIFRSVYYYLAGQRAAIIKESYNLYRELGFSVEECRYFEKMEQNFQNFLLGNNRPLWKLYDSIRGEMYFPNGDIECHREETLRHRVKVVKQYKDGRTEDYYVSPVPDANGVVCVDVFLEAGITWVCLKPAQQSCFVRIRAIIGEGMGSYCAQYGTNGISLDNQSVYFTMEEPQIWIADIRPEAGKIHAEWQIEYPARDYLLREAMTIEAIRRERKEREDIDGKLQEKQREIQAKEKEQEMMKLEIEELRRQTADAEQCRTEREMYKNLYELAMNSKSWKLTKPLRKLAGIIRR